MIDACMISRKGKVIPVESHPYIDYDIVQMDLEAGLWFYENTDNEDVKQAYIDFVAGNIKYVWHIENDIISGINGLGFKLRGFLSFVKDHLGEIEESLKKELNIKESLSVLKKESDQEFMRVRYGGVYKTKAGVREIYFRISSYGFNWHDIIWQYVYDNRNFIDYVTIVRDIASTGSGEYYRGKNGEYNLMPVAEFLEESGNPVIEWKTKLPTVRCHLALGGTINGIANLPMNPKRAQREFELLQQTENSMPQFWYEMDYLVNEILDGKPVGKVLLDYN